jgi:DNA repair exonuclease SbcCD nuclease subunit
MKFLHMGDCHLGGWRQPELMALNLQSFQIAVDAAIKEKIDFVLIAGDLFDSAYPPIEIIKEAFNEFRRLREANIPVFLIAGSHDYSASGRTFLDVLEKAGFAKNVFQPEERNGFIYLHPTIYKNIALYGYPGKKSALEVEEIARIKLHDAPGLFKILMLHTALRDAVGSLPIPAVDQDKLPKADYTALAHLHINYNKNGRVYCGPLFPNNAMELEELKGGSYYVADTNGKLERREIKIKPVLVLPIQITNALTATEKISDEIKKADVKDKIVILNLHGFIETGKLSDIRLNEIEWLAKKQGSYVLLKNLSKLHTKESELRLSLTPESLEEVMIEKFSSENPSQFNQYIHSLISVLQLDKKEDEKSQTFESRLIEDAKKVLRL